MICTGGSTFSCLPLKYDYKSMSMRQLRLPILGLGMHKDVDELIVAPYVKASIGCVASSLT
jgi:hypothetical protein